MVGSVDAKRLIVTINPFVGRPVALSPDGHHQAISSWADAFDLARQQDALLYIDVDQAEKVVGYLNAG
jgi:hypothetical protein